MKEFVLFVNFGSPEIPHNAPKNIRVHRIDYPLSIPKPEKPFQHFMVILDTIEAVGSFVKRYSKSLKSACKRNGKIVIGLPEHPLIALVAVENLRGYSLDESLQLEPHLCIVSSNYSDGNPVYNITDAQYLLQIPQLRVTHKEFSINYFWD